MTSPLIRTWLAARLPDWADHGYAIWRGILHWATCRACKSGNLGPCGREWDPCQIEAKYLVRLPAPAVETVAAGTQPGTATMLTASPSPAFHTMLPCPVCHVSVGKDCVTRFGNVTGPHRARRDAAARQDATS